LGRKNVGIKLELRAVQQPLFLCLVMSLWLAAGRPAQPDQVDDYVRSEMKERAIPGVALAIVHHRQVVKTAAYGLANVELGVPVRPETVFEIGSLTKQFTAAGILLLTEDGKVCIEDKISRYLGRTPEAWRDITVRHLLTHTSGIRSYTGLEGFELRGHLTQRQFIEVIGSQPLEFRPGESWKYSNTGYNLLGYIIENITGKTYWDFMSERIFKPLTMNSTTNRLPALVILNRAAGYEQTNRVLINRDSDVTDVFSAGAMVSTIGDLVKWNAALDSDGVLSPKSKQEMWTRAKLNNGELIKYGFGWRIEEYDGHRSFGHGGSTSGFSATLQRFPDDNLAVILLTNTDEQIATALAKRIARFYWKG